MNLFRRFHSIRGTLIKSLQDQKNSLKRIISQKILSDGPMSFADYMELCLSHPEYGYYSKSTKIFGKEGDFITSPEISQLFGESLAI